MNKNKAALKRGQGFKQSHSKLKNSGSLKRGKSLKKKPISDEQKKLDADQRDKDWEFYKEIWDNREHRCQACDVPVYGELRTIYMDHLVEKSTHPELRYEESNIEIVCWECHSNKTNAGPITDKYRELINEAKRRFNIT